MLAISANYGAIRGFQTAATLKGDMTEPSLPRATTYPRFPNRGHIEGWIMAEISHLSPRPIRGFQTAATLKASFKSATAAARFAYPRFPNRGHIEGLQIGLD